MHDLVIKGGTLVDGTGAPRRRADVAIDAGRITAVGDVDGEARNEVDAEGLLVTPGFVDIHTHYDGQVTWDPWVTPSSWHGVTTAVMGNCGVGFAPADPDRHDWLIGLMEGVEDIPGSVLHEGIRWDWESFPEYLDAVERAPHAIDIAAQVPHGALRAYVMGERGADHDEEPTQDEIVEMARLVEEGLRAGALGFTTSRTRNHRARDGRFTPSLTAGSAELLGIAEGMSRAGAGVFELVSDFRDVDAELGLMRAMAERAGRPLSVSLAQANGAPTAWREVLKRIDAAQADGVSMAAQVACRPIGLLQGWDGSLHPFLDRDEWRELASLPRDERLSRLRDPEVRARMTEPREGTRGMAALASAAFDRTFPLGDPPDYEPLPETSLSAIAEKSGRTALEVAYDLMMERDGGALLYMPFANYADFNLDATREMLQHPHTVPGLGDGGAHCGFICDGSFPTYLLTHWARDRSRGERLGLEWLVMRQTRDTASLVGLCDRGVVAPGMRADLNIIDFDRLTLRPPEAVFDLPAGGRRLIQKAEGYVATIVAGEVVMREGEPTGALPGRLVRGAQPAPVAA